MPSSTPPLPPREANTFKSVVRFYETKQLKKAIKSADSILRKFPNHGETLAMKGLALNALDRKEEAHELVRKGLRLDMRSHICWHVYGLLYRSDRDYREAAKAYLNALRIDKDNQQILRDLSLLQIQIRDFEGLEETRRKLLTIRPNQKNNWIGFALSFHLLGNFATAISVLDTYQDTLKGAIDPEDPYEVSELILYKNLMLEESGEYAAALKHLEENESRIVDHLSLRETRARLFSYLGRHEECATQLRALVAVNPDNVAYHRGLQNTAVLAVRVASGAGEDEAPAATSVPSMADFRKRMSVDVQLRDKADVSAALKACDQLSAQYPRSRTSSRIALDIIPSADHPQFLPRFDAYVRPFLRRGVPSLFSDIKPMYSDASKVRAIGILFEKYLENLKGNDARLPPLLPLDANTETEDSNVEDDDEAECTLLWTYHYLAQHYDRIGMYTRALELIEEAIGISPKTVEPYLVKARILKHCGDTVNAVKVADEARSLDLADRYLNTKCTKYGLRADMVPQAESWIGLFTRDGDSGGPQALYDMQCMWFELEAAESHLRRGQLAQALKKFTAVDRHFADMVEDQFDFHSYCLRKVTLRAYVSLLRFEDRIRGHPYFARAASGAIKCLLQLADLPEASHCAFTGEHSDIEGFAEMSPAERKKAISKQKKREAKKKPKQKQSGTRGAGSAGQTKPGKASKQTDGKANGSTKLEPNGSAAQANAQNSGGSNNSAAEKPKANPGWMETDPEGTEQVKTLFDKKDKANKGPLESAVRLVREMEMHLGDNVESHFLAYEVAIRRKRYLQALRAVKRAQAINNDDPSAVSIAVRLMYEMDAKKGRDALSQVAGAVFDVEGDVLGGKAPIEYLEDFAARQKGNAAGSIGAAEIRLQLAVEKAADAGSPEKACEALVSEIRDADAEGVGANVFSAAKCKALIDRLQASPLHGSLLTNIVEACREKYAKATCFVVNKKYVG